MPIYSAREAKRGDALLASRLNEIEDALRRLENVRGGAGIDVRQTKGGLQIAAAGAVDRVLAQADPAGAYAPRRPSTIYGQARACWIDPTTGVVAPVGPLVQFFNISATDVKPGDYFWAESIGGLLYVVDRGASPIVGQVVDRGSFAAVVDYWVVINPVSVTGVETEGGPAVLTVDGTIDILAMWIGPLAPAVGDLAIACDDRAGNFTASSGAAPSTTVTCSPCAIPKTNLNVSWTNGQIGGGSTVLVYDGAHTWSSVCANQLEMTLSCAGGSIDFEVKYFYTGGCPTGAFRVCAASTANPNHLTLGTQNCSPFVLVYSVTSPACPGLLSNGFTSFAITS